jgi:long-chain acyl-CoA synthetase
MDEMNLNSKLMESVSAGPDRTAIVDGRTEITYGELAALASAGAGIISKRTARRHIGISLPPSAGFAVSFFAAAAAGRTVVPINFMMSGTELDHVINDSGLDTVITTSQLVAPLHGKVENVVLIEEEMEHIESEARSADPGRLAAHHVDENAPAVILYTSGTSARAKGVVLSHRNLVANCESCIDALGLTSRHVLLAMLPFFHSFGLTTGLLLPLSFGGRTVMLSKFGAPEMLELVERHKVSIILTIPSIWNAMLRTDVSEHRDLSSLEICVSGGEPLPTQTYDRFLGRFGFPLSEGYGLTETSPVVSIVPMGDRRRGSAGKALPRVLIRIVDDAGNEVARGAEGEICVAGPNVMTGYLNLPEETASTMTPDGYLRTGDLGWLDQDGFLYISGRRKELIISAGANISPREVEEAILLHSCVADAAVVGVSNGMRGEVVKAFVVLKPASPCVDKAAIRDFCAKRLALFKVPRFIEFVDQLPRGFTGKVLKRKLVQ